MNYKLSYDYDPALNCGIIRFDDNHILIDFPDLFSIVNFDKNFIYYTDDKEYPYYLRHNQKITYNNYVIICQFLIFLNLFIYLPMKNL